MLQAKTQDLNVNAVASRSGEPVWDFSQIPVHDRSLVHEMARTGLSGEPQTLPYQETIQRAFGHYVLAGVNAFVGGPAASANERMRSRAFTSGAGIAFKQTPDLHTAAHEATHIVQQRSGLQLPEGIGRRGDAHERHADAVADAVVRGESVEPLLDQYGATDGAHSAAIQFDDGEDDTAATTNEANCEALRAALADSQEVIALYKEFLAGNVDWETLRSKTQMIGNAAQGVTGAGASKPQVVKDAIEEVESFGLEELVQGAALLGAALLGDDKDFQTRWVKNEIERQNHYNLVLIRKMYENGCPDFPGTFEQFEQQILRIGTKGREMTEPPGTTTTGRTAPTKTALAWVDIDGEEVLILATEVGGSGRLRFETWIDQDFKALALAQARAKQGAIPSVPASVVTGLPATVPDSAARP